MKIQSNFSDYYDSGLMYGVDELILFRRLSTLNKVNYYHHREIKSVYNYMIRPFIICFCGKIFFGVRFEDYKHEFISKNGKTSFYTENGAYNFLDKIEKEYKQNFPYEKRLSDKEKNSIKNFISSSLNSPTTSYGTRTVKSLWDDDREFSNKEVLEAKYNNMCIDNNIPYLVIYREDINKWAYNNWIEYNPQLALWDFVKVKNPIEAFQEISMYVGGVLQQPVNPMVEISNKDQAIKKGFGHKYAFRKEPTKRRIK